MKRNCNFQINPAFSIGFVLMWVGIFVRNVLEPGGPVETAVDFLGGAGAGLVLIGFLYGAPVTRPLFGRFHAFKLRLLGRESA